DPHGAPAAARLRAPPSPTRPQRPHLTARPAVRRRVRSLAAAGWAARCNAVSGTTVLSPRCQPLPICVLAWTPRILAILRRYHVPGTFFVVGTHAASYPGLIRQELADGAEIGSHTYTHLDLAGGWQEQLQLTLTQNALAGAAGVRTALLRPPYSSTPD